VAHERHHHFRLSELLDTIRTTSSREKFAQLKRILTG
jgi:hypothetical protein